jgi:hypothetical protein
MERAALKLTPKTKKTMGDEVRLGPRQPRTVKRAPSAGSAWGAGYSAESAQGLLVLSIALPFFVKKKMHSLLCLQHFKLY